MKILIACDKFKGTFTSKEMGEMIAAALRDCDSAIDVEVMQVSDGGDGLIESIRWRNNFSRWKFLSCAANTGRKIQSKYLYNIYQGTAIVESAATSGMQALRPGERRVMALNSYGLGLDIARVLEVRSPKRLVIGVGGTATNDMFLGAAKALGFKFMDSQMQEVDPVPENFLKIQHITRPSLPKLEGIEVLAAADVTSPLCGPCGASAVYGPQKGATPEQVQFLDKALAHIAAVIEKDFGASVAQMPGAGAGGGIAGGIAGLLGGKIVPGADFVLDAIDFGAAAAGCDMVITGEGRYDSQSLCGKIASRIADRCKALGKPYAVICGTQAAEGSSVLPLFDEPPASLSEAREATPERVAKAARKIYWMLAK